MNNVKPIHKIVEGLQKKPAYLLVFGITLLFVGAFVGNSNLDLRLLILAALVCVVLVVVVWMVEIGGRKAAAAGTLPADMNVNTETTEAVKAMLVSSPNDPEPYEKLFAGFSKGDFYAFNAPFAVEEQPGAAFQNTTLETHEERYETEVESCYLFFDIDSLERAKKFFSRLETQISPRTVSDRIQLRLAGTVAMKPDYTFFMGFKGKTPVVILYPSAVVENGVPRHVIYIEGAGDLNSIMTTHFTNFWNGATEAAFPPA